MDKASRGEGTDGGSIRYTYSSRQGTSSLRNTTNPNVGHSRPAASPNRIHSPADSVANSPTSRASPTYVGSQYSTSREPVAAYLTHTNLRQLVQSFLQEHNIGGRLENARENRTCFGEDFVGGGALLEIWSSDRVEQFLRLFNLPNDNVSVQHIRQNCVQILSLLVTIRFKRWERFSHIANHRRDNSIPFTYETLQEDSFLGAGEENDYFAHRQDSYRPIIIEEGKIKEYSTSRRLPFIRSERENLGEGSYGKVTREVIPLGQYKYKDSQSVNTVKKVIVARKRFQARPDYEKEAANLKILNQSLSKHDHVVQYLAMLIIGNDDGGQRDFNILLPCADMDLKMLLDLDLEFSTPDLIKATCGLADAIKWLHDDHLIEGKMLTCCHMDLKMDNILVYHFNEKVHEKWPVGVWKISDFGISSLEKSPNGSRAQTLGGLKAPRASLKALTSTTIRIPTRRRSAAYQAPEVATLRGHVGRSSDVWSFGCILFQVLARGIGPGKSTMEELNHRRTLEDDGATEHPTDYFYRENNGTKYLNPHVKNWLKPTGKHESYFIRECKGLILLMLNIEPSLRPKSKLVNEKLSSIAHPLGGIPMDESISSAIPEEERLSVPSKERLEHDRLPSISISKPEITSTTGESSNTAHTTSQQAANSMPTSIPLPATAATARNLNAITGQTPVLPLQSRPANASRHSMPTPIPRNPMSSEATGAIAGAPSLRNLSSPPAARSHSMGDVENRETISNLKYRRPSSPNTRVSRTTTQSSSSSGSQALSSTTFVDSIELTEVKNVLIALMSSYPANEALITPTKIYIRMMSKSQNYWTIVIKDHKWESGNIAGNYLCVVGKEVVSMTRKVLLFKLPMANDASHNPPPILDVSDPPAHFSHVVASRYGRLLFQDEDCAWLYKDYLDINKKELVVNTELVRNNPKKYLRENLQRLWFSEDGAWVIVQSSSSNNYHRIRIWNVDGITRGEAYTYLHNNPISTNPIRSIIPFPKSPRCILWDEHSNICILAPTKEKTSRPFWKIEALQAITVTPDEKHVIFIVRHTKKYSLTRYSNILSSTLQEKNGHMSLVEPFKELGTLKNFIVESERCAITVDNDGCPEGNINLHVLHSNGTLDQKTMLHCGD